jgi:tetratricopeptide (TPR) repeat protein
LNQETLIRLRQILVGRFSLEQLYTLCFDLGIDYENLPGHQAKPPLTRELVAELQRRCRISDLEAYILRTRPDISKAELTLSPHIASLPDLDTLPDPGPLPLGSRVPFTRNALFTGREEALKALARALLYDEASSTLITQAVQGIGGIGKTQLAVEFTYRYGRYFQGVHWVNAAQPDTIGAEIVACGQTMMLSPWPNEQPEQIRRTLMAWKRGSPRLLILDNLEDVEAARDWLRELSGGPVRVMVTARRRRWPRDLGLKSTQLPFFSPKESLEFLRQYLSPDRMTDDEVRRLAERLYNLPLALELAGRYLAEITRVTVEGYLEQLDTVWEHRSLAGWRAELGNPTDHDLSLAQTFALSWNQVDKETVRRLFLTAGWCAPKVPIPWEVLTKTSQMRPRSFWKWLLCLIKSSPRDSVDEGIGFLVSLGLLELDEREIGPTIHPLLAEYARSLEGSREVLETLVAALTNSACVANRTDLPTIFTPLRLHVKWVAEKAERAELSAAGTLWNELGYHLIMIAEYTGAQAAFEQALAISEKTVGSQHAWTAIAINNLGHILQAQGRLTEARAAFERALSIDEAIFGHNHPSVSGDVNNLGLVLRDLGDLAAAQAAFEQAIRINEEAFGSFHPRVAKNMNNLGLVLHDLGDLEGARAAYERALEIEEAAFGSGHPNVARDIGNLGMVMNDLGEFEKARTMVEQALEIDEAVFGPAHPKVAIRLNSLGNILWKSGDLAGARTALERALVIWQQVYEEDNLRVATAHNNLGAVLLDLGDLTGARVAYERALMILEGSQLPADHPDIQTTRRNLVSLRLLRRYLRR